MQRGEPVALGFRARSGWAAMVIVAGPAATATVLARRHVGLASAHAHTVQPYHAARGLSLPLAEEAIGRAASRAQELAGEAIREALAAHGRIVGCGIGHDSERRLPSLAAILASHALVHTAEGQLFRESIAAAAAECGLRVTAVPERELYVRAAVALGVSEAALRKRVAALGTPHGAPWREDEKLATVAALLAL